MSTKDFLSLERVLEEARCSYNIEQQNFSHIETKTSRFLTLNSILLISLSIILGSILSKPPTKLCSVQLFLFLALLLLFLLLIITIWRSIYYSFKIYDLKQTRRPHKDDNGIFYQYAKKKDEDLCLELIKIYNSCYRKEREINASKLDDLKKVIDATKASFIFLAIIATVFLINLLITQAQ